MPTKFEKVLKEHKTTTSRVSRETGLPHTTLYEWKKGVYVPNAKVVKVVAEHLDVPMEDIV